MIGRLRGVLAEKSPAGLLIDVHGVGFRVAVSLNAFSELADTGTEVELLIHTHMRDTSLELFGFVDEDEKSLFLQLVAVSGIGPRMALTILSGMPTADLITALAEGNTKRLVSIPGIGKRTAERMVVELQDKVAASAGNRPSGPGSAGGTESEAVSALVNLGYREAEADAAVRRAVSAGGKDLAAVIREALKTLGG